MSRHIESAILRHIKDDDSDEDIRRSLTISLLGRNDGRRSDPGRGSDPDERYVAKWEFNELKLSINGLLEKHGELKGKLEYFDVVLRRDLLDSGKKTREKLDEMMDELKRQLKGDLRGELLSEIRAEREL